MPKFHDQCVAPSLAAGLAAEVAEFSHTDTSRRRRCAALRPALPAPGSGLEVAIPIGAVTKIGTLIIHLSLTKHQVKDLPPVDIDHLAG